MARRVYWVTLYTLVNKLCEYWLRYSKFMPSDLPASVATAMAAVTVACDALKLYDNNNTPGKPGV